MSDNMEREKNERLNARKIEEEEMKRELTGIGIYEPGFTYNQMKQILGFLNESEDTSNVAFNNGNTLKGSQYSDNESLAEAKPEEANASQECAELSRASYKKDRTSPTMHSESKTVHYSSNLELLPLYEKRNPTYRRKSSDSDELMEKQHESSANSTTHGTNRFYSSRPGNPSGAATSERKADRDDIVQQKLERWQLNPLDVCLDEKDVPLQQPSSRPFAQERAGATLVSRQEASTSEQFEQEIRVLSQRLKETAELWYTWHPPVNSEFQWGSPIQVGTANGSLDRTPLTDTKTEHIRAEYTHRDNHERSSKRRAYTRIANLIKESSSENECDSIFDFPSKKKKKKQQQQLQSNSKSAHSRASHAERTTTSSSVIAHQEHSRNDDGPDVILEDDSRIESPVANRKRADGESERLSPELIAYPRRITPPIPKARLSLSRYRKNVSSKLLPKVQRVSEESRDVVQAKQQRRNNNATMSDNDIRQQLEEDWSSGQEEEPATPVDVEIRPLSIPETVRTRLSKKQQLLNNTEASRETRAALKVTESSSGDRERDTERLPRAHGGEKKQKESSRMDNKNGSWEQLLSDDEDELLQVKRQSNVRNSKQQSVNVSTSSDNVPCPICNKLFSHNEIEGHAADCEQFEANDGGEGNDGDVNEFVCSICDNYKTSEGKDYEQHVHECIHNRNNQNDKRHSHEAKTVSVDSASTSSFTNYKPISQQVNSEIDYLSQFASNNSRTKTSNTVKKRKR